MKLSCLFVLSLLTACLFSPALNAEDQKKDDGFKAIFDGKTLDGWEGKDFWSVKDGAITGQTTSEKPTSGNTFLVFKDQVKDFELRLKFRIVGGNSGIQYRSENVGDFVVKGYQADFDASNGYIGILYGERTGRGIICPRGQKLLIKENGTAEGDKQNLGKTCDEKEFLDSIKKEDWNEYVIIAKGNHLVQKINGFTTVDVTDEHKDAVAEGIIALQLHAGPPMLVQFKDIELKELN